MIDRVPFTDRLRPTVHAPSGRFLRSPRWALWGLAWILGGCGESGEEARHFDLLFVDATVLDGSGGAATVADVGIVGDRIEGFGDLEGATAGRTIDATGLHLTPGFIDVHSHSGTSLDDEERSGAVPLLAQGITTVFINPDGGGPTDMVAQEAALVEHGLGVNVAQFISHGSIRSAVLGMEDRAPTEEELEQMRQLVRGAMEAGAFGMSSGPFYAPGSYSETSELVELARAAAPFGGVYSSHIRDESDYSIGLEAAVAEVITVAEESGLTGVVTHIKALGPPVWGLAPRIVETIDAARARGVEVYADQYPYDASSTGLSAALVPRWAQAGGGDSLRARLADPATRARVESDMAENLARRGGPDRIRVRSYSPEPEWAGDLLSEFADRWEVDGVTAALTILSETSPSIISYNMDDGDIHTFMRQPWTMTSSDGSLPQWQSGLPHPRAYGSFPRKIRRYVLDEEVVDLPTAIRSMTGLSAEVMQMPERGRIEVGYVADIAVFDLNRIRDLATYEEPHQLSEGMIYVVVNGRLAIDVETATGKRAGRVLDHAPATRGAGN